MHCVVTGGAGFIGSNTVDELVRCGHKVTVFGDLSAGKMEDLAGVNGKINFVHGSITDLEETSAACRGADYVLHLAAMTLVPRSVRDPVATNRVNVDGIVNFPSAKTCPRRLFRPTEYRDWWASCMAAFSSAPAGSI